MRDMAREILRKNKKIYIYIVFKQFTAGNQYKKTG
jgi:hypothetical protein